MMNFIDLCAHRRSIRKYTGQPIEQQKIDYILQCALMAPSSKRSMPWEFVVVSDREKIQKMAGCKTYGSQMLTTAQAAIVVALDTTSDTWQADGAIAAEHILLAAEEQGLGACWCHVYQREDSEALVRSLTAIPESLSILCIIALGYKDEEHAVYDPARLKYNKIHNEVF